MPKRSYENDEFDYDNEDYEDNKRGPRRFKKEEKVLEKKKTWDREDRFNRDHDYDEHR